MRNALECLDLDAHLYVWIGTDYREGFQPLPDFHDYDARILGTST